MAKMKIKKGDLVQVISGKDSGDAETPAKRGRVISVDRERQRVVVEGINRITKHTRAGGQQGATGGIQVQEAPIHVSNVMVVDPETDKPTRVRTQVETEVDEKTGRTKTRRTRIAVRSGKEL